MSSEERILSEDLQIKFGTDGWRAIIADEYTFANVRACARAVALDLIDTGEATRGTVVGYDTRFISDRFAKAVAEELASFGIDTQLFTRPAPTPACSFSVTDHKAAVGVMITASHNPPEWNGFKIKSERGGSAPPEHVERVEAQLRHAYIGETEKNLGKRGRISEFDPMDSYVAQLGRVLDLKPIRDSKLRVVVDAMHGSGAGVLPRVLAGGNIEVTELRSEVNPAFPGMKQPEPIAANLGPLREAVVAQKADVGIALDGDADRVGVVDENGRYLTTLDVFSLLSHHLLGRRGLKGGVASTLTMSSMVDSIGKEYSQPVYRTAVGFKYVGPVMVDNDCVLGGEESGGYAFRGHVPERDGSLSGLFFLEAMTMSGKTPSGLLSELHALAGPHVFRRDDVEFEASKRGQIMQALRSDSPSSLGGLTVEADDRTDGVKFHLKGGSWAMARLSGTEPLARVYAEAPDEKTLDAVIRDTRKALGL